MANKGKQQTHSTRGATRKARARKYMHGGGKAHGKPHYRYTDKLFHQYNAVDSCIDMGINPIINMPLDSTPMVENTLDSTPMVENTIYRQAIMGDIMGDYFSPDKGERNRVRNAMTVLTNDIIGIQCPDSVKQWVENLYHNGTITALRNKIGKKQCNGKLLSNYWQEQQSIAAVDSIVSSACMAVGIRMAAMGINPLDYKGEYRDKPSLVSRENIGIICSLAYRQLSQESTHGTRRKPSIEPFETVIDPLQSQASKIDMSIILQGLGLSGLYRIAKRARLTTREIRMVFGYCIMGHTYQKLSDKTGIPLQTCQYSMEKGLAKIRTAKLFG